MLLGYPIGEIVMLALWIIGAGVVVGVLAGLFGIGGGAVIVPVLYEVFRVLNVPEEVRMQLCIGTSLAIEELFAQAGFPEDLFRSLVIRGSEVAGLIEHPKVHRIGQLKISEGISEKSLP